MFVYMFTVSFQLIAGICFLLNMSGDFSTLFKIFVTAVYEQEWSVSDFSVTKCNNLVYKHVF